MARRTQTQRLAAQEDIMFYLHHEDKRYCQPEPVQACWHRPPEGARAADIKALEREGLIEREVRTEFDKQRGNHSHAFFGGAGVVQRRRTYIKRTEQEQ